MRDSVPNKKKGGIKLPDDLNLDTPILKATATVQLTDGCRKTLYLRQVV